VQYLDTEQVAGWCAAGEAVVDDKIVALPSLILCLRFFFAGRLALLLVELHLGGGPGL
jgi:hypothetical protein